jgi:uroporphyrinogen-III synthase
MVSMTDSGAAVLVTRTEPGASELAEALRAAGYVVHRVPVLEIVPIDDGEWRDVVRELDRFAIAICVSAHAVRFALERIDVEWKQRPELRWIAVGAATARALAERGIAALRPEPESSEGILALAPLSRVVGQRLLICAGRGGRPLLAEELSKRGALVTSLALYERVAVPVVRLAAQLGDGGALGAVIVSSADGARAFAPAWRAVGGNDRVVVVAPSARVAEELRHLGFQRVAIAEGAGAGATIEALRKQDEETK